MLCQKKISQESAAYFLCTVNLVAGRLLRNYLTSVPRTTRIILCEHCNTLQHTATHCNTLHHTATHCNTLIFCTPVPCTARIVLQRPWQQTGALFKHFRLLIKFLKSQILSSLLALCCTVHLVVFFFPSPASYSVGPVNTTKKAHQILPFADEISPKSISTFKYARHLLCCCSTALSCTLHLAVGFFFFGRSTCQPLPRAILPLDMCMGAM